MIRLPMKYEEVDVANVDHYVESPSWVLEQKLDGTRALVVVTRQHGSISVEYLTHGARRLTHSAAAQHFGRITAALTGRLQPHLLDGDELVLDSEVMWDTGTLFVFDLPYARVVGEKVVGPRDTWDLRHAAAATLWTVLFAGDQRIRLVRTAVTEDEKRELVQRVRAQGAEGLVAKKAAAPYVPGKRVGHVVKLKFVKTADVIVVARNLENTASANLAVYGEDGRLVDVGRCSMLGKPDAQPGQVIEVKYLYAGDGGRMVQPRMMRLRPDKPASECRLDQFTAYSRAVIA